MNSNIDATVIQNALADLLQTLPDIVNETDAWCDGMEVLTPARVQTFAEVGMLTQDAGIVLTIDGQKFNITIQEG
jgi:hypothetical protein